MLAQTHLPQTRTHLCEFSFPPNDPPQKEEECDVFIHKTNYKTIWTTSEKINIKSLSNNNHDIMKKYKNRPMLRVD